MHSIDRMIRFERRKMDRQNSKNSLKKLNGPRNSFLWKAQQKSKIIQLIPNDAEWAMQHNYVRDKVYASVPESARKLIKAEFIG
jgi:hypothetical protein